VFRYFPYDPGPPVKGETQIVHVTDNPEEASRAATGTGVMGDVALAIRQLTERLQKEAGRPAPPPLEELPTPEAEGSLPADYVLHMLAQHLPDRAVLVEETPSSRALLHKHVRIKSPGGFYAAASGGLGFGTSASIGLKLAQPDRPVVCVVGDGSLMYAVQALWSAAHYGANVAFVVMNNQQYKILRLLGEREEIGEGVPGLDLPGVDIVGLAGNLGCEGASVESPEELPDALEQALAAERPYVLNVLVDPNIPKALS
jgi:benzoylformate decarboxylase